MIPKARIDVTPEHSNRDEEEVKFDSNLVISIDEDLTSSHEASPEIQIKQEFDEKAKRGTVIQIPKPIDEQKEIFKKMLYLNDSWDNSLERKPVYAWENTYRDIEQDKQVSLNLQTFYSYECYA